MEFESGVNVETLSSLHYSLSMNETELRNLAAEIQSAAAASREALAECAPVRTVLERLWLLQDLLGRLVDALSDAPEDAAELWVVAWPTIVDDIRASVISRCGSSLFNLSAVARSRAAIATLTEEVEAMRHGREFAHSATA